MAQLSKADKHNLAQSVELMKLYQATSAIQDLAFKRIQNEIANGNSLVKIKGIANNLADDLHKMFGLIGDSKSCGQGEHWDPALGECVPDNGGNNGGNLS